jgi:NAD(P)-dependent dehydrogenase (short-subunit alcohol dehydrogenase family)
LNDASAVIEESKKFSNNEKFRAIAVQVDVSDEAAVQAMVVTAVKEFGRIDYCVHCAGVSCHFIPLVIETGFFDCSY